MQQLLLQHLSEFAKKRAMNLRDEAQLWDILSRDLKREVRTSEETSRRDISLKALPTSVAPASNERQERLFVRIPEAARMMGIGKSSLYEEIGACRLAVRKSGRKTLIALSDIQAWFDRLPTGVASSDAVRHRLRKSTALNRP